MAFQDTAGTIILDATLTDLGRRRSPLVTTKLTILSGVLVDQGAMDITTFLETPIHHMP